MGFTIKRPRKTPLYMNVALSFFHEWACGPLNQQGLATSFLSRARETGLAKVALLRHGRTAPAVDGIDFNRLLTDQGRQQAQQAGEKFGPALKPFFPRCLVSPSPRTMETAEIFLKAAAMESAVELMPIQELYDGTMDPKGSELFRKIGYAPLRDYVDAQDPIDRELARRLLGTYAETFVKSALAAMNSSVVGGDSHHQMTDSTLWFVGHAIYLPAAALGIASLAQCPSDSLEMILSTSTVEAEGYLIDLRQSKAEYLSRT